MGRAEKLKEQRKIEKMRNQLDKEKKLRVLGFVFLGVIAGLLVATGAFFGTRFIKDKFFADKSSNTTTEDASTNSHTYSQAPDMQIDTSKTYIATVSTNYGDFQITLNDDDTPTTVNNFVFLARDGYYDGLTFHRVVQDFMIQGGDPSGNGTGGPGYAFDDEDFDGDYTQGVVAMANSGENTNGSQFFVMTGDYSGGKLSKDYTIFGSVKSGLDVVLAINEVETVDNGSGEDSSPVDTVTINSITIEEQ